MYAEYLKCLLYDLAYLASPSASPESPISWICDTAEFLSKARLVIENEHEILTKSVHNLSIGLSNFMYENVVNN